MKTAGQILKETRLKKNLSLEQVARDTKIQLKFLRFLEKDAYRRLPSAPCARGFLKNYAEYLNLPFDEVLAVFRRDFDEEKNGFATQGSSGNFQKVKFNWTPKITTFLFLGFCLALFLGYLVWQYFSLVSAPYY